MEVMGRGEGVFGGRRGVCGWGAGGPIMEGWWAVVEVLIERVTWLGGGGG